MNYREQGFRDGTAGAKLDECMYFPGTSEYAAWRAGWRDADDALTDSVEDAATPGEARRDMISVAITRTQRVELPVLARKAGMTISKFVRSRVFAA